jgi:hypothetical protein
MYKYFFYQYYIFSEFIKSIGGFLNIPSLDSTFLLSSMEAINLITIKLWLNLPSLTGNNKLDTCLAAILLFIINYKIFLFKKKNINN